MRRILAVAVGVLALAALAFAGGGGEKKTAGEFKVAAVFQTAIEEPWDGVIHQACLRAQKELGIKYEFAEKVAAADFEKVLREYAERGFDLIVGDAFLAGEEPSRRVAKAYPKIAFAFGSEFGPAAPNYAVFDNWIHEPAYLCGVIAGRVTKKNVLGVVAAIPIGEVNRLVNAFKAGALSVNKNVKVKVAYIGGWFDPPKAKEAAFAMIDKGADVMYAERFGVSDAAKERKVLAIGNVIDTQAQYPDTVVASALWNMEPTIDLALKTVKAGKFVAADYGPYSMMKYKGSELSPLGTFAAKVPKPVLDKVAARQKEILAGSYTVKVDDGQPKGTAK